MEPLKLPAAAAQGERALPTGRATMTPAMQHATRYARYLYGSVRPWLRPPILEVGVGFGTYTPLLLRHGPVIAIDIDSGCLEAVERRLATPRVRTCRVDLNNHDAVRNLRRFGCASAFSTNVIEHIEDDVAALAALHDVVRPGGYVCVIVPAHPELYGYMDAEAGHFRRYTRRTLASALRRAGWHVTRTLYLNALGGLGWWVNNRLLKPKPLDAAIIDSQLRLYDRFLVPVARFSDFVFQTCFGLSVVGVGHKRASEQKRAA